jgi:hypothetical protein
MRQAGALSRIRSFYSFSFGLELLSFFSLLTGVTHDLHKSIFFFFFFFFLEMESADVDQVANSIDEQPESSIHRRMNIICVGVGMLCFILVIVFLIVGLHLSGSPSVVVNQTNVI